MKNLSLLIKPASSLCNMACSYCFYHSLCASGREVASFGLMKETVAENIVIEVFSCARDSVTFAFQGGEPTLWGIENFKKFIGYVKAHNLKKIPVSYAIQTNGTLINDEWCEFLRANNFLLGLSLDGPREIHDANRVYKDSSGSFDDVMRCVELLRKHRVHFNILSVITALTARHAAKIYKFFKDNGFGYLQFIPCLEPFAPSGGKDKGALTPGMYGTFLKTIFKLYSNDLKTDNYTSIRYFDNLISMILGAPPEACDMNGCCSIQFVIESNGMVYPCDFYCTDEWQLGNVADTGFEALVSCEKAVEFLSISHDHPDKCKTCEFYRLCRAGCRRTRSFDEHANCTDQFFCQSYLDFFKESIPELLSIVESIRRMRHSAR